MDAIDLLRKDSNDQLKAQTLESRKRRLLYTECFGTHAGRRVLLDILTRAYTFSSTFTGNSHSYFNEGARAFALEIMSVIPAITGNVIMSHLGQIEADLEKQFSAMEGEQ